MERRAGPVTDEAAQKALAGGMATEEAARRRVETIGVEANRGVHPALLAAAGTKKKGRPGGRPSSDP